MNEQCPVCDSYKTVAMGKFAIFIIMISTGSCLFWVGILFPPIWIAAGLMVLGSPVSFFIKKFNMCRDCNKTWEAGKSTEYKQADEEVREQRRRNLTK